MNYKFLLLFMITFFAFSSNVSAGICDSEHISQLKELADQVDISYEYLDYSDEITNGGENDYPVNRYSLVINLLSTELYLSYNDNNYFYKGKPLQFYVSAGNVKMKIYSSRCADRMLKNINLQLPKFNPYSYKDECELLSEYDLDVCDPWYQGFVDEVSFYDVVNKYFEKDDDETENNWSLFLSFISKHKYNFLFGFILIIVVVVSIIFIKKYRKRWELQ